ncbi:hypothetical protein L810_7436 [Burkholderia sp. AU4i]|nr:hypothetical protein L810_7436 [Burkholderia sp. AU4i]
MNGLRGRTPVDAEHLHSPTPRTVLARVVGPRVPTSVGPA